MSKIEAHETRDPDDGNRLLAVVHPASQASVNYVLAQSEESMDGRSNWVWVRLPNGDLILGVYPQGDTYFSVEKDACYPPN
jgi:hypothetical protein